MDTLYSIAQVDTVINNARKEIERLKVARDDKEAKLQETSYALDEEMVLSQSSARLIADTLEVPELEIEIERAVAQVERSLAARRELAEEKRKIESATRGAEAELKR